MTKTVIPLLVVVAALALFVKVWRSHHDKLSAAALARWLDTTGDPQGHWSNVECSKTTTGGWEYVCTYDDTGLPGQRMKWYWKVNATQPTGGSNPEPADSTLPPPPAS